MNSLTTLPQKPDPTDSGPTDAVSTDAGSTSLESEVIRLHAMQGTDQHEAVVQAVAALLTSWPDNRDLLLLQASALRYLQRTDEALAVLDHLASQRPNDSLMHQERGLCFIVRRDAPAAIFALNTSVAINPALSHAWHMLAGLYRLVGEPLRAGDADAQCALLRRLPPPIIRATALFSDGDLALAETMIRRFLLDEGDHPEAMRLLAKIGRAHDVLDDAELLYAGVLALAPDHHAAAIEYVDVLIARHKYGEAHDALTPLLAQDPNNPALRQMQASIAVGLGQHEEAIHCYRDLIKDLPEDPGDDHVLATRLAELHLWLGHALKTLGLVDEGIAAYRRAVALRQDFGDGWWSLANLKVYRFDDTAIAAMLEAEAADATAPIDRVPLLFALGKALEDAGDAAQAWQHYARGNALQRANSAYRPDIIETNTREQKRVCTPDFFEARQGWGCQYPDPIFIVGLPRSGSTLIEQILASHGEVEGTQELPEIQRAVLELQGRDHDHDHPKYPASLTGLSPEEFRERGERYLAETRVQRTGNRRFFVDKMPNNFRHIGYIHLILPKATIIDARREPQACCFSNLKQLFAQGQEFTYSAEDIARYYRSYLDLMRHWDHALPGRVLRVIHEDVLDDLEGQVRRILDHCRLDFDQACLNFHQNRRAVRTPSSEQVRRPIFRDGIERWKDFSPFLDDLRHYLGDSLSDWRS